MAEDSDQNYAKAGYHHGLGFAGRPVFMLVDLVRASSGTAFRQ